MPARLCVLQHNTCKVSVNSPRFHDKNVTFHQETVGCLSLECRAAISLNVSSVYKKASDGFPVKANQFDLKVERSKDGSNSIKRE